MGVRLPKLISDGMVLQRGVPVTLWGQADEPVTLRFLGHEYRAMPDVNGKWSVVLDALPPGGPYTLSINETTLRDVYVGDIWLLGGQSNMQLTMERVKHMYPHELSRTNPSIRQFSMPQRVDFHGPQADLPDGAWEGVSPETIRDFSAVGYFFACRVQERYQVPIGLLLCAIGGTPIHAWMSREALSDFPEALADVDRCGNDAYVAGVQAEDQKRIDGFYQAIHDTDPGIAGGWHIPTYDDSKWVERPLLAPWAGTGSFWLRKTLMIPPHLAGKRGTLFLGTLTDWDAVYVNGVLVGNTTYRYPPREYIIPALPAGQCTIAIRAISRDGGGFTPGKQYLLATDEGAIDLNENWKFRRGGVAPPYRQETVFHYKPTGLYNGMLAPLMGYTMKGALWYQGESDADIPERYAEKFSAMVRSWRKGWNVDFPILFVELAYWSEGPTWDRLRTQQRLCLKVPGTAMAAADDAGEHNDLHPLNKQTVGDRLARCAMRLAYGEKLPPSPFEVVGVDERL